MFRLVIISFILLLFTPVFAQKKKNTAAKKAASPSCQATEAPTLRKFFVGQTVQEINKIIPNFEIAYKKKKEKETYFPLSSSDVTGEVITEGKELELTYMTSEPFSDKEERLQFPKGYEDVSITWYFFRDKLYGFSVGYNEYDPPTSQSFVKQLVEKAKFPVSGWIIPNEFYATLKCSNFNVRVGIPYRGNPADVQITDTNVEAEIRRLNKAIKQRKIKVEQDRIELERKKREPLKP